MIYTLIGVFASAVFGIAVLTILGPDALAQQQWIDQVFWALFGSGLALNAIDNVMSIRSISCWISQRVDDFLVYLFHTRHHCAPFICDCDNQTECMT